MLSTFSWFFLSFRGRSSRQEFWLGFIGSIAMLAVLTRALPTLMSTKGPMYYSTRAEVDFLLKLPSAISLFIVIWPLTAIFVKRLHDFNASGWWLVGMAALPPLSKMMSINLTILYLVVVAVLGLIPGARGSNRFGVDPLVRGGL